MVDIIYFKFKFIIRERGRVEGEREREKRRKFFFFILTEILLNPLESRTESLNVLAPIRRSVIGCLEQRQTS